jgi:hypothetical protein
MTPQLSGNSVVTQGSCLATPLRQQSDTVLEVAMYNGYCWWKVHGRIWGYSKENPNNQYDPAVISPMWASVVHVAIISSKLWEFVFNQK